MHADDPTIDFSFWKFQIFTLCILISSGVRFLDWDWYWLGYSWLINSLFPVPNPWLGYCLNSSLSIAELKNICTSMDVDAIASTIRTFVHTHTHTYIHTLTHSLNVTIKAVKAIALSKWAPKTGRQLPQPRTVVIGDHSQFGIFFFSFSLSPSLHFWLACWQPSICTIHEKFQIDILCTILCMYKSMETWTTWTWRVENGSRWRLGVWMGIGKVEDQYIPFLFFFFVVVAHFENGKYISAFWFAAPVMVLAECCWRVSGQDYYLIHWGREAKNIYDIPFVLCLCAC